MPEPQPNKVGTIPDFTDENAPGEEEIGVQETETEKVPGEEETQPEAPAGKEPQKTKEELETEREALERDLQKLTEENERRRQSVIDARKERRTLRETPEDSESIEEDLSDVDPADIQRLEKVLKARGYVPRTELEQENVKRMQESAEEDFFTQHSEYSPDNDSDDMLYGALREEIKLYARPTSAAQMKRVLARAHEQVSKRFPSRFESGSSTSTQRTASKQKAILAGTGGGTPSSSSTPSSSEKQLTNDQITQLRLGGWSEEEIQEIQKGS